MYICFINPSCIPLRIIYIWTGQLPELLEKFHFKQSFVQLGMNELLIDYNM